MTTTFDIDRRLDYTPQTKAALATFLLMNEMEITTAQLKKATGITTAAGIRYLMGNVSAAGVPVYQPRPGVYRILDL